MAEAQGRPNALLLGDDLGVSKQWAALAAGLFVLVSGIFVSGYYRPVYALIPGQVIVYGAATVLVLLSAWQAYQNRGLVVSVLLSIAPVSALFLQIIAEGQGVGNPSLLRILLLGVGWGIVFGGPVGVVGFLLGYMIKRGTTVTGPV